MAYYPHQNVRVDNGFTENPDGSVVVHDYWQFNTAVIEAILSTFAVLTPDWLSFIRKRAEMSIHVLTVLSGLSPDEILSAEAGQSKTNLEKCTKALQSIYFDGPAPQKWVVCFNQNTKTFYCQHVACSSKTSSQLEFDEPSQIPFMV